MLTPLAYMYFSFEEDGWQASKLSTTTLNVFGYDAEHFLNYWAFSRVHIQLNTYYNLSTQILFFNLHK